MPAPTTAARPGDVVRPLPLAQPAPSRPDWHSRGMPEHGLVLVVDLQKCSGCKSETGWPCLDTCSATHNLPERPRRTASLPGRGRPITAADFPRTCVHCENAPCIDECPVGAITHNAAGAVVVDQELCIGCRFCADVCPDEALLWIDPFTHAVPPLGVADYRTGQPTGLMPRTVAKCTMCTDRLADGLLPVCVGACAPGALYVGNVDRNTATNGQEVRKLTDLLDQRRYRTRESRFGAGSRLVFMNGFLPG